MDYNTSFIQLRRLKRTNQLIRKESIEMIKVIVKTLPQKKAVLYSNDIFVTDYIPERMFSEVTTKGIFVSDENEGTINLHQFKDFSTDLLLLLAGILKKNYTKIKNYKEA